MSAPQQQLLTVREVAAQLQVTSQTIRNWIDQGVVPAIRVGRAFRIRREDVETMLEQASAESASLTTRRGVWAPNAGGLPRANSPAATRSVWEAADTPLAPKPR